ncbi:hypothetical protein [Zunongwangia sp.]|uniref:hypothetical protein n=1 Tax=Zunongwangia sp. TaxID=1965325 RepID=UPI003AA8796B
MYRIFICFLLTNGFIFAQETSPQEKIDSNFNQYQSSKSILGIGGYTDYTNKFTIIKQNFIKLEAYTSLIQKYEYLSGTTFMKYSFGGKISFSISPKTNFYIKGRHVSLPFYASQIESPEQLTVDPIFPKSEIGFGVETQIQKNINFNIDSQFVIPAGISTPNPVLTPMIQAKLKTRF